MLKEEKIYIGIDVSKAILDMYVFPHKKYMQFSNSAEGIQKLVRKIGMFTNVLVVMESTGGYESRVSLELSQAGIDVCVKNPRHIRSFAQALGRLAKTDKVDAEVIALYASKIEPKPNVVYDETQRALVANNARRRQLVDMIVAEKNRLDKATPEQTKSIKRVLKSLEKELKVLETAQAQLILNDERLTKNKEILGSINGVGEITATAMLSELPELGTLNPKQIASLSGLAPFNRDSGTFKGKRTIWGGRASVRIALYMPTLSAIKHNPKIRAFYQTLCLNGKNKMTAVIACMRKLLIIMNAMIRKQQSWDSDRDNCVEM